jgi:predicted dehydrogenase
MADTLRVGIIGAGWPGQQHAKGFAAAGGFKVVAVSDLIPARREKLAAEYKVAHQYLNADELIANKEIDVVSVGLPNFLHAPVAIAALKAGKHVICEKPPARTAKEAKQMETAAAKAGKVLMYAFHRRFGGGELAARQAIEKGHLGDPFHVRAGWMRTRGIPIGTGWFTKKEQSGGGAMIDIGVHMLDLAWYLMGEPTPVSAFAVTHRKFGSLVPESIGADVDDSAFALIRFDGNRSLELGASWAINQGPHQEGATCRVHGDKAAIDVYTPHGATIYRNFDAKGVAKATPLKGPKTTLHVAMMRHFRECVLGRATPSAGAPQGLVIMQMLEAIYKSAETGKSVAL